MRTSKDQYKTKKGNIIAVSQNEKAPEGSKIWNGYDYKNQYWVYQGKKDERTLVEIRMTTNEPIVICFRCGLKDYESVMNKIGRNGDEHCWLCDTCKDNEITY